MEKQVLGILQVLKNRVHCSSWGLAKSGRVKQKNGKWGATSAGTSWDLGYPRDTAPRCLVLSGPGLPMHGLSLEMALG